MIQKTKNDDLSGSTSSRFSESHRKLSETHKPNKMDSLFGSKGITKESSGECMDIIGESLRKGITESSSAMNHKICRVSRHIIYFLI